MKKLKLFAALLVMCTTPTFYFMTPTYAETDSNEEMFVEHIAETDEDIYFTLDDIISQNQSNSQTNCVREIVLEDGTSYTLPQDPIYSSASINEENGDVTDSIIPGSSYNLVSNVNNAPYCKTVLIAMKFQKTDGSFIYTEGSGAMVGNKVLLTAGHVIYHIGDHLEPYEIRVFLKVNTNVTTSYPEKTMFEKSGYYHPYSWVFSSNFKPSGDPDYDWCYLTMSTDIGNTYTGWYGLGTTANNFSNNPINVNGYPDVAGKRYRQYTSSGTFSSLSDYRVSHTCSTEGGQSGGPLYSNAYVVWGVHTHGTNPPSTTYNSGARITSTLYTLLINKINATN
jgi:V8-like Glu-specific endopeptidase